LRIGYHASHEQHSPSDLLDYVQMAEASGFQAAMCSDHLMPWSERQGHSGFAWSWLGAALQATKLSFGVVNAPGARYHPVIIAQAAATLAQMFPGRFWIAIGSGEALNEHVTGEPWPPKDERNERLVECATIMRRLWNGETVTHHGHVTVVEARLYSLPEKPPPIIGAALTAKTAEWMGSWADGLITVGGAREKVQPVLDAFRRGGGEGKRIIAQAKISWARTDEQAAAGALDQWNTNVFPSSVAADLAMPEQFEELARGVTVHQIRESVLVSSDLDQHAEGIRQHEELGIDDLYIHNVNCNQREFIDAFGRHVLPAF
jgi:probable non-F420 flavinoid oxidoreductase